MTENSTQAGNDMVRSGMADDTWPNNAHTANAGIMAPPRDWNVACAVAQARMGVALTEGQREIVERAKDARAV